MLRHCHEYGGIARGRQVAWWVCKERAQCLKARRDGIQGE